jgi:hypothetical protein
LEIISKIISGPLRILALVLGVGVPSLAASVMWSAPAGAVANSCAVHVAHNGGGDTVYEVSGCSGYSIRAHVFNSATLQSRRGIWVKIVRKTSSALLASNHGGYDIERTGSTGGGTFHETY